MLSFGFLDELASAVPSAGAPGVRASFSATSPVDFTALTAALLAVPMISAIVLEAPLLAASDRWARKHLALATSLAVMAAAFLAAGSATSLVGVTCALSVAFPACGVAGALAEATLIGACDSDVARARAMARWSLAGALGDTAGPLVLALALGWRGGASVIGVVVAFVALLVVLVRPHTASVAGANDDEDAPEPAALLSELLAALRRPALFAWLLATALCSLLDETLIAFAALHWDALASANGYGRLAVGALLAAFSCGGAISLLGVDVVLARSPASAKRLLATCACACALSYCAWLVVSGPYLGASLFFLVGACTSPLWPLCQARVYDLLPGRPGLAAAASTLFSPIDVVAPLALGLVADRSGVVSALTLLLLQPLGILALLATSAFARGSRKAPCDPT